MMDSYFGNSTLTIVATSTEDPTTGCFVEGRYDTNLAELPYFFDGTRTLGSFFVRYGGITIEGNRNPYTEHLRPGLGHYKNGLFAGRLFILCVVECPDLG